MANEPILRLDLPRIKKIKSGKVREIFDLGDALLLVASDRISAFDVIMPNGIPRKGEVLTQISHFWFEKFASLVPNHLLRRANEPLGVPALASLPAAQLADLQRRSMVVKKAKPLAIECIVRGYLSGSGWKEYKKSQTVCGIKLPARPHRIRRTARTDFHAVHQGRGRPRRKHLVRTGSENRRQRTGHAGRAI